MKIRITKSSESANHSVEQKSAAKSSAHVFEVKLRPMRKSLLENLHIVEEAERQGKRFCPNCGGRMKTCCDLHRQFNISDHRPNGIHEGPEEWICLYCRIREYRDPIMRTQHRRAGTL